LKKIILLIISILILSTPSYADYLVKLNTDITKYDVGDYLLGNWLLVDNLDNLDVAYVQENYTYTACDFVTDINVGGKNTPVLLTNTDIMPSDTEPKNNVKIAIIDSGIDLNNKVLSKYIAKAYNVQNKDNSVQDECGHGTHIAGIITGISNNMILPVKVLNSQGTGKSADIAVGIKWAVDEGAKIINLSLGGTKYDQLMKEAIDYAREQGSIVVCASGNVFGERTTYPACYDNVISVGAIDKNGEISPFSNRGDKVDVYAFGIANSYDLSGNLVEKEGTSMACAYVSAELSLVF
jgi:subtilisin family serine protease